jgi:hypothetical protein
MSAFANYVGAVGNQPINDFQLPDTTQLNQPGMIVIGQSAYWGGGEFIYCRANGTIASQALVVITPSLVNGQWRYDCTECPNTANLGRMVGSAMAPATAGQFIWVQISGVAIIRATASVAADTTFGITGAGQIGANSAGKQILNARVVAPATTTVVKNGVANAGSNQLRVNGADGWFIGAYLSGTGIAAGATITEIDPSGTVVTMSAVSTALVNGSVTATYNNGAVFFNVAHLNRPFAQGAIT